MSESFLCHLIKFFAILFRHLPSSINQSIASLVGILGYYFMSKKRHVIAANLKIAFPKRSASQRRFISKQVFKNFAYSFIELLCLPKIKAEGFEKTVVLEGREHIQKALAGGQGCIFLAVHSGNWELASLVGSMCDHSYNIVANDQSKAPKLNHLLNEYRTLAGAKVIPPGTTTRDIIRALKNNEIVSLVLDQGGKEGTAVEFFCKTASMSTGAIRLALKYQTPICPVWIERRADGKNVLRVFEAVSLVSTDDHQRDVLENAQKLARFFEYLIEQSPYEYMWFYKVYKYSTQANVLILDDGKTGHLRQSQALAEYLKIVLHQKKKNTIVKTVRIEFKNSFLEKTFVLYCVLAQLLTFLRSGQMLRFFLKDSVFIALIELNADYIISCGSQGVGINFMLSKNKMVKSFHILKNSFIQSRYFSLIVLPEHDRFDAQDPSRFLFTKVALNLINSNYLKEQEDLLLFKYSHLKSNVRTKIGVLLGGNTKGVKYDLVQIRFLIKKLKEAALHYNVDLLLTTSRRTPLDVDEMIAKELKHFERCPLLIIANETNMPEAVGGIMSLSDLLIVSGESISMVSEAVSSFKKTIVFAPTGDYSKQPTSKYDRFVMNLNQQGYVLASSIKDISTSINQAMSQKVSTKSIEDDKTIIQMIEGAL